MSSRHSTLIMPYQLHGPESNIPIVLVPGGLSGWISWKPHAEILSKERRVIRVQLLNMADAEENRSPPEGYSLRSESTALKSTLDSLKLNQIHLAGWSHGGEVSLDFALDNPERIKTLTLIEPAAYWIPRTLGSSKDFEEDERKFREILTAIHDPVTEDNLIRFLQWNELVPPGGDPRSLPQWPTWNNLKRALLTLHTVIDHSDDPARLKLLRDTPILLVKGRDSKGANAAIIETLAKTFGPKTKLLVLPDAHACHIVATDQFLDAFQDFIKQAI